MDAHCTENTILLNKNIHFFCHTYLSLRADPSSYFEFLDVRVSAFVADLSLLIITIIYQYTNKMSIKYVKLQVWYACHILYRYA